MADHERPQEDERSTRTQVDPASWQSVPATRLPGLTVLYHPDLERVGERALLPGLAAGRQERLSRREPDFAAPGGATARPLEDPCLSRTPIVLAGGGGDGEARLDVAQSRTRVVIDGRPVAGPVTFSAAEMERGVVLLLGGHVVVLLHLLDPLSSTGLPRFGLVGESPAMARVRSDIRQVADLDVPVLIRGESGSGKELVARALHDAGPRRTGPYVAVNMAAVPASLAAAELFGAARGAFTGADRPRQGYFGRSQGGTLFLDEIGETPPEVQVLLLRSLETGEIQPVGAEKPEKLDVRVVSATDSDLEAGIATERFRAPLLHRLSGYVIQLPPLRERREDFGRLFVHFLRRELAAIGESGRLEPRPQPWLPAPLIARLATWEWPGNVRQLANAVRQLVIANRSADPASRFEAVEELLDGSERAAPAVSNGAAPPAARTPASPLPANGPPAAGPRRPSDIREDELLAALRAHRFRPAAAAQALGIRRSSIYDLIARCPGVRKASELTQAEILAARKSSGGSVEAMAEALEVSAQALRRRLKQLDITV